MAGRIAYYGNIVTQGLVLNLDAGIQGSYPKTGSTWFDISNNGNNGTLTNGPLYTGSDYGALVFDGVDDYVDCGNNSTVNLNSSFTINCWVKISPTAPSSSGKGIVGKYTGNTANRSYLLFYDGINNLTTFVISTDGTNTPSTFKSINSSALLKNIWYNITAIFRASSSLEIYINGTLNSSDTTSFSTIYSSSNQPLTIGAQAIDSGGFNFQGSIATTQIYNQSLTQFQVWQNFNAYKSRYGIPDIVTDGLVLNLDAGNPYSYLSGSSGTTWTNTVAVSSSISGSLVNGTTYSNGAMVFDGVDDWATLPAGSTFAYGTGDFTIECWFKDTSATSVPYSVLYSQTRSGANYFLLGVDTVGVNGRVVWVGTLSGGGVGIYASGSYLRNTWNHAVASRTSGIVTVYLNGVGGTPTSNTTNFTNTTYVPTIADESHHGGNNSWTGNISTIRLYKGKGLTSTEVQQNFNALRGRYGL